MAANKKIIQLESILIEKGFNARVFFDQEKLNETKKSILSRGLMYPISVKSINLTENNFSNYEVIGLDGQKQDVTKDFVTSDAVYYSLVDGERRLRCYHMLLQEGHDIKGIASTIEKITAKKDDLLITSFLKNTGEPFTPVEEASLFFKLINVYNWTVEEISETIGKSKATINSRMLLLEASSEVKEAIQNKEISLSSAISIIKDTDEETQNEKLNNIKMTGETPAQKKKKQKEEELKDKIRQEIENENNPARDEVDPFDDGEDATPEEEDDVDAFEVSENNCQNETTSCNIVEVEDEDNEGSIDVSILLNKFETCLQVCKFQFKHSGFTNKENYDLLYHFGKLESVADLLDIDLYDHIEEIAEYCEDIILAQ